MSLLTRSIVALAVLAPIATAVPAQAAVQAADCGRTSASILFWPKGHGARPGAGFPAFKTPHVEVYGGKHTTSFPNSASDAYLDSKGTASVSGRCGVGVAKSFSSQKVKGTTRTGAANIVCSFGGNAGYRLDKISGGARLQILLGDGTVVLDLKIKKSGSQVSFSKKCKAHAPPK